MGAGNPVIRSISMYVLATMFFVALDSLAKIMVGTLPLQFVVWGRYAGALLILTFALPFLGVAHVLTTRRLTLQMTRGALLVGATACMFQAVSLLPVAESYAISYVSPLIVVVLASVFLAERISPQQGVGVVLGFVGVLIIIRPGFHEWRWAMFWPLGTAAFYAMYQILTRVVGRYDNPFTSLWYVTLGGALITSLALPWSYTPMPLSSWFVMGIMGALGTIGHFLVIKAYTVARASVLSPFIYTQIIWAGLVDQFVFKTSLDPFVMLGAAVVIGAGLLIIKGVHTQAQPDREK